MQALSELELGSAGASEVGGGLVDPFGDVCGRRQFCPALRHFSSRQPPVEMAGDTGIYHAAAAFRLASHRLLSHTAASSSIPPSISSRCTCAKHSLMLLQLTAPLS